MNAIDIRRLGLILATQTEIEGMKIANAERDLPSKAAAYSEEDFQEKANELRNLVYCPEEHL